MSRPHRQWGVGHEVFWPFATLLLLSSSCKSRYVYVREMGLHPFNPSTSMTRDEKMVLTNINFVILLFCLKCACAKQEGLTLLQHQGSLLRQLLVFELSITTMTVRVTTPVVLSCPGISGRVASRVPTLFFSSCFTFHWQVVRARFDRRHWTLDCCHGQSFPMPWSKDLVARLVALV